MAMRLRLRRKKSEVIDTVKGGNVQSSSFFFGEVSCVVFPLSDETRIYRPNHNLMKHKRQLCNQQTKVNKGMNFETNISAENTAGVLKK